MDADEIRTLLGEMVFERAQKYRRRILRKRWRRNFAVAGLLVLLILLSAVGLLWKRLHHQRGWRTPCLGAGAGQWSRLFLYTGLAAGERQLCQCLLRLPLQPER